MPKSKRNKVISLTATQKRSTRENKNSLFASIRESAETYPTLLIFSVANMRNTHLKTVRSDLSDARLFFGKTKVMAKALGTTPEEEHLPELHRLAPHLTGSVGLLFSPRAPEELIEYFSTFVESDYARMGAVSPVDFVVPPGVVYSLGGQVPAEEDVPLAHSLETAVRGHGMPTKLVKGKVWLDQEFVVCREGQRLDSKQAALLKVFGKMVAKFQVKPVAYWTSENEEVTVVDVNMGE